jgi:hypothetical protein
MIKRTVRTRVAAAPAQASEKVRFTCPCGTALRVPVARVNGHGRCPVCVQRLLLTGTKDRQGRWHLEAIYLGNTDSSGSTFIIEGPPPPTARKPIVVKTAPVKAVTKTTKTSPTKVAPKAPTSTYRIEIVLAEEAGTPHGIELDGQWQAGAALALVDDGKAHAVRVRTARVEAATATAA